MKYIFISIFMSITLIGCTHNMRKDLINTAVVSAVTPSSSTNTLYQAPMLDKAFDITITPDFSENLADPNALLLITDKRSGKTWSITHKQFSILNRSFNNWQNVIENKPIITSVGEANGKMNIVFNYYDENKKSILSGTIIIDKDKASLFFTRSEWMMYTLYTLGGYSALATVLLVCVIIF